MSVFQSNEILSLVDPKVLSITIEETGEPLVDLREQTALTFGSSPEIPDNQDYTKVRRSVYERLLQAQRALPHDLKFCLYEG